MRFQFCGNLEPPGWVLLEIRTLARIVRMLIIFHSLDESSVRLKILSAKMVQEIMTLDAVMEKVRPRLCSTIELCRRLNCFEIH